MSQNNINFQIDYLGLRKKDEQEWGTQLIYKLKKNWTKNWQKKMLFSIF